MKLGILSLLAINLIGTAAHAQYGNPSGDKSYIAEYPNPNTGRSEYRVIDKTYGNQGNALYRSESLRSAHEYREVREGRAKGSDDSQEIRSAHHRWNGAESDRKQARHSIHQTKGELFLMANGKILLDWKDDHGSSAKKTVMITCNQNNWFNKPFVTLGKNRFQFQETCGNLARSLKMNKSGKMFVRINSDSGEIELLKSTK